MFFKNFKNIVIASIIALIIIPLNIYAYSDYIIPGGETIGIKINAKGILVVGTYKINEENPSKNASIKVGDIITKVNNIQVENISQMIKEIDNSIDKSSIDITYLRSDNEQTTSLKLVKDTNSVYKTGLYVKDSINGLGTLTYIDPETNTYGALGHEIIEKNTGLKLEVKDGSIYKSEVVGINKSNKGIPGEKNAKFYSNDELGNVFENSTSGVFGKYTGNLPDTKVLKVASVNDVKTGNATIRTVLKGDKVEEFGINILKVTINDLTKTKNLLFEITDESLLNDTGGIVQGMSGSPIIQGNFIIGAVTHVVVDDVTKGYGIYIKNMLEAAEN